MYVGHHYSIKTLPVQGLPASPVIEECSKEAGIEVVQNDNEHVLSELEGMWELLQDLPHTVHELKEDG